MISRPSSGDNRRRQRLDVVLPGAAARVRWTIVALDLDAVVVEHGAASHVGVSLVHGGVDGRLALHEARPLALGAGHHAPAHAVGDLYERDEGAAIVEDAGLVAR